MTSEQPDPIDRPVPMDAVRAADPAAGSEPDLDRLRAALAASTGVPLGGSDELAARRARRTPRWVQVAAAVAGVALVGTAGYALGAGRGADEIAGGSAAPAMSLDGGGGRDSSGGASSTGTEVLGADAPADGLKVGSLSASMAGSTFLPGWSSGRTVFTARGLSDAGGEHDAWAYDAAGTYSKATAEAAAKALGVHGSARESWGWTVGPDDGTGPTVSLAPDGLSSLSYYDPTAEPAKCIDRGATDSVQPVPEQTGGAGGGPAADSGAEGGATPETGIGAKAGPGADGLWDCADVADAPTGAAAVKRAKAAIASVGADVADLELEEQGDDGSAEQTTVLGYQVVDGQRTGAVWSVQLGHDGLVSLNGPLAPLVALGSYDVVGPAAAVERLGDPRFGATLSGVVPLAARGVVTAEGSTADAPTAASTPAAPTVPATPTAGAPIPWPVDQVTITKARLGVAQQTAPDGATTLLPTYELTGDDGSTWTALAVADDQLDLASR